MPQQTVDAQNMECQTMDSECKPVELQPFIHQVGGHTSMFKFNDNTVCKPLCSREYHFYATMPEELRPFTPECRGVVNVEVSALDDDTFKLMAHRQDRCEDNIDLPYDNRHLFIPRGTLYSRKKEDEQSCIEELGNTHFNFQFTTHQNPWVRNMFNRQMRRLSSDSSSIMLLENMVAKFNKPCVMDLKMGQRQHGDDASPEKRQLFQDRCKSSTSNQLGVRASGMQVYQVDNGEYIYFSKYDGRALSADGFRSSLGQFLHNGKRLRQELIAPILSKLQELIKVVKTLDTFRFYSSSLLIMYDGIEESFASQGVFETRTASTACTEGGNSDQARGIGRFQSLTVDVRMVDFAHSTYKGFESEDRDHSGTDDGHLHGLSTLVTIFQELQQQFSSSSGPFQ